MTTVAWAAVALFVGVYVLIATERVHRVAAEARHRRRSWCW